MGISSYDTYCFKFNKYELGNCLKMFVVSCYEERDYNYYVRYFGEKKYKTFKQDCDKILKGNYNLSDNQNWGLFLRDFTTKVRTGECLKKLNEFNDMFKKMDFGFDAYTIYCYENKIILTLIPDECIVSDSDSDSD